MILHEIKMDLGITTLYYVIHNNVICYATFTSISKLIYGKS